MVGHNQPSGEERPKRARIAIFASPKCVEDPKVYKAYFNVAWFVRAFSDVLEDYEILTTYETKIAIDNAPGKSAVYNDENYWTVPEGTAFEPAFVGREGFDGQVHLAGQIARRKVERVLMFMDPLDTKEYLPETYAFIRNCALAGVGLHINIGATYWAENKRRTSTKDVVARADSFGKWKTEPEDRFHKLLNPKGQRVFFVAHDGEKEKLSKFVFHYRKIFSGRQSAGWTFSGTSGTLNDIQRFLSERMVPYWEIPRLKAAGAGSTGHGPTGGDVVIADEICERWPVTEGRRELKPSMSYGDDDMQVLSTTVVTNESDVRRLGLSHTVFFFIDYYHAQPHEADIHVLLRTCLNPHRGVNLILNERTAVDWAESIREGCFS